MKANRSPAPGPPQRAEAPELVGAACSCRYMWNGGTKNRQAGEHRRAQPPTSSSPAITSIIMNAQRISDEHRVVVEAEAPAEREQQPHERHRQRDQQPAVFVGRCPGACRHSSGFSCAFSIASASSHGRDIVVDRARRSPRTTPFRDRLASSVELLLRSRDLARRCRATGVARPSSFVALLLASLASLSRCWPSPRRPRSSLEPLVRRSRLSAPVELSTANIRKTENRKSAIGETNRARSPVDVAAGQLARPPREHRQRAPDLAFEMEHAVREVVEEGAERPVDVGMLAAGRQ